MSQTDSTPPARSFWWGGQIYRGLIAVGVCTGIVLRWARLGHQSLWFDEGYTAWMVSHPPREIIRLVRSDTAPPLYYLSLWLWTRAFGTSEAGLRSLSALCSSITLLLTIPLARRISGRAGVVAGVVWLGAISFFQVLYAQEARAYALMALCIVAGAWLVAGYVQREKSSVWLLLCIGIITAAGMYTHNMMLAYLPSLAAFWWIVPGSMNRRRRLRDGLLLGAVVAALYAPWALASLGPQVRMVKRDFWVPVPDSRGVTELISSLAGVQHFWSWDRYIGWLPMARGDSLLPVMIGTVIVLVSVLLIFGVPRTDGRRLAWGLALHALLPVVLIAIYSRFGRPVLLDKVFLASAALIPIFVGATCALNGFPARWNPRLAFIPAAVLLVLSAASLISFETDAEHEDWRGAAAVVAAYPSRNRLIIFDANDGQLPFDYYLPADREGTGSLRTGVPSGFFDSEPPRTMLRVIDGSDVAALRDLLARTHYDPIVLVESHTSWSDTEHHALRLLCETRWHLRLIETRELKDVTVYRFGQ